MKAAIQAVTPGQARALEQQNERIVVPTHWPRLAGQKATTPNTHKHRISVGSLGPPTPTTATLLAEGAPGYFSLLVRRMNIRSRHSTN